MIGVIDVGGGTRDIYGAGVFDYCLENGIHFDYCIGVSAGSANCASYLAGQKGRNYQFYTEYGFRRQYMSLSNFIHTGSYIDLEYIYATLSNDDGENPLDYEAIMENPAQFKVVATDAVTGKAVYFDKEKDMGLNDYRVFMASCCTPIACKPYCIDGIEYYDGGISDPIPLQKALDDGCDKVVIILTKPIDISHKKRGNYPVKPLMKKYINSANALNRREENYQKSVLQAMALEQEGKALIIAPRDIGRMKTLTKDLKQINKLYQQGIADAEKIREFCNM